MRRTAVLLLLALAACTPAPPPGVELPAPKLAATGRAQRVVLLSFDGLGADALAAQKDLPAFEHLAREGASARIIPVNPTLTGPTHVSILTGADPQVHGIVSNWFHLPDTPPEKTVRGVNVEISVETLVESARRQGKRVGAVPFPTVDATTPRRTADFGIGWTGSLTAGKTIKLTRADFHNGDWVPPTWTQRPQRRTSFSPVMRTRINWAASKTLQTDVDVIAYDTTNDATENYDTYTIENDDREVQRDADGWFAVEKEHHGSWSKLVSTSPALDVTLYWGPVSRTNAYPDAYRDLIDNEVGFWPGEPDEHADTAIYAEQMERLGDFLMRAQAITIQRVPFDLLLAYQPMVDEAMHNFLGFDDTVIRRAFVAADRAAATVGSQLDANRDALVIVGDHGLVPVESEVRINRLLAERGFFPRWRAYVSNNLGHFYRYGEPDDSDALIAMLNSTGWFEKIEKKTPAHHRNSGDVIATTFPPIGLSAKNEEPVVVEPDQYGHHGALNTHRELHPAFFASGAGTPRGDLGEISQTKIARFVSELLGIAPPNAAE